MDVSVSDSATGDGPGARQIEPPETFSPSATGPLKRSASQAFEDVPDGETSRKRIREDRSSPVREDVAVGGASADSTGALADNLEEELQCGCCSAIVYRPVVVAPSAPTTTRCDFCQVSFCGIGIPQRCIAAPLAIQHPHGFSDLSDLIQCGEVYDCFDGNTVEVDIMLDYLTAQGLSPRHIYREIVAHMQTQPRGFAPLIELDLFMDLHPVPGGIDPDPNAPRTRICRMCSAEVLLYGLRDWWIRERKKGFLEEHVMARPDCAQGGQCPRQKDHAHAKEFNHLIAPADAADAAPVPAPVPAPLREPNLASAADFPPLVPPPLEQPPLPLPVDEPGPSIPRPIIAHPPPPPALDVGIVAAYDAADFFSAPSSQDFRDEVDALL
ncbi:hypothetical protein TRAPUB_9460 [Trametes pubescens]|uniref:E3 ubiquitin-protein ligase CHFR cysteine rich domain-containing protein n=1 Tax=Trametes pubescens TaxID=154538 RepID=A0A1M2W2E2_TRAPU|nr:hypothetical protein TRAPUB_9460 [Trametes pubescens]